VTVFPVLGEVFSVFHRYFLPAWGQAFRKGEKMKTSSAIVLKFWFEEIDPSFWFKKDDDFDAEIRHRFLRLHTAISQGEGFHWRENIEGRLAEIIVLDQFSRNIFRDQPSSFAYDRMALALAQEAVATKLDPQLPADKRAFLYMPYMHSESLIIHDQAMKLFNQPGLEHSLEYEIRHRDIIERFGRYPHRNQILNRLSTPEELDFLKQPNSSF